MNGKIKDLKEYLQELRDIRTKLDECLNDDLGEIPEDDDAFNEYSDKLIGMPILPGMRIST